VPFRFSLKKGLNDPLFSDLIRLESLARDLLQEHEAIGEIFSVLRSDPIQFIAQPLIWEEASPCPHSQDTLLFRADGEVLNQRLCLLSSLLHCALHNEPQEPRSSARISRNHPARRYR